jgi:hypothetical protein
VAEVVMLVVGAAVGVAPGVLRVLGHVVFASTGGSGVRWWLDIALLLLGLSAGSLGGLAIGRRLSAGDWPSGRALLRALGGLALGLALGAAFVGCAAGTPLETAALALAPVLGLAGALLWFRLAEP